MQTCPNTMLDRPPGPLKGAIIFYREGGRLFVGGTRIFWGGQRGGPVFFSWQKRGDQTGGAPPRPTKKATRRCVWGSGVVGFLVNYL